MAAIAIRFIDDLLSASIVTGERDYEVPGRTHRLTLAKPNSPQTSAPRDYASGGALRDKSVSPVSDEIYRE